MSSPTSGRTAWLAGAVLGLLVGFLGFEFPTLAIVLLAAAIVVLGRDRTRTAGIGGLLVGGGVLWVVVLVRAVLVCQAANALPNEECVTPDVTPYVVVAAVVAVIGGVSSLIALRRSR